MSDSKRPIVFIVDDNDQVRRAVQRLVTSVGLHAVSLASAHEFLEQEPPAGPSCLVLDVRMPVLSGLDLQQKMAEVGLNIPIIFVTGHGTVPMSVRAMKAGAVDFLQKPFEDQELLDAVNSALERSIQHQRSEAELARTRRGLESLTPREREVFALVVSGLLNKQIAAELGMAEKTVKVHRSRVMQKMRADSLAELVRMAERLGIEPAGD